jgi:hypothetical protein
MTLAKRRGKTYLGMSMKALSGKIICGWFFKVVMHFSLHIQIDNAFLQFPIQSPNLGARSSQER